MRRIAGTSAPERYRIRRRTGALGDFLCRIFRSESRFRPWFGKRCLASAAVDLSCQPLYLRGGAHLGVEPPGRIELVPRGLGIATQPRQLRTAFMHFGLPRPGARFVDQVLGTEQRLLGARPRVRIRAPELGAGKGKIRAYLVALSGNFRFEPPIPARFLDQKAPFGKRSSSFAPWCCQPRRSGSVWRLAAMQPPEMPFVQSIPRTLLPPTNYAAKVCSAPLAAYPAGADSVTIFCSMPPNSRRVR